MSVVQGEPSEGERCIVDLGTAFVRDLPGIAASLNVVTARVAQLNETFARFIAGSPPLSELEKSCEQYLEYAQQEMAGPCGLEEQCRNFLIRLRELQHAEVEVATWSGEDVAANCTIARELQQSRPLTGNVPQQLPMETGSQFDILLQHHGSSVDMLQVLADKLTTPTLAGLASSCHALYDGSFSRIQATDTAEATQALLDKFAERRSARIAELEAKVGAGPEQLLREPSHIDWSRCGLDANDMRLVAGLCVQIPIEVKAHLRVDEQEEEVEGDEDEDEEEDEERQRGFIPLADLIGGCPETFIENEGIASLGALVIAGVLKFNASLKILNLQGNRIGNQGATAMGNALAVNVSLTALNLYSNEVADQGAIAIGEALKVNTTLTTIGLNHNHIGGHGAIAFAQALEANTTLRTLTLGDNKIGDHGATAIAKALEVKHASLTSLELQDNSIRLAGGVAIAKALESNASLTTLVLGDWRSDNNIGDEGAIALGEALKVNMSMTDLNLRLNGIGAQGAMSIAEALKVTMSLTKLDLRFNCLNDEVKSAVKAAAKPLLGMLL